MMMLRSTAGWLALVLAGAGVWAGYEYFGRAADWIGWTTFGLTLKFSDAAQKHAHYSFALACGVALASVPIAGLIAMQFAKRAPYWRVMLKALATGAIVFVAAAWYHRRQAHTMDGRVTEVRALMGDSQRFVLWNPMSQVAAYAGMGALAYGLLKGTLLYSRDGR